MAINIKDRISLIINGMFELTQQGSLELHLKCNGVEKIDILYIIFQVSLQ